MLDEDASKAKEEIRDLWNDYNIRYPGYPPDWEERRGLVKLRDGWRCAECGWPAGVKRKARNLHVHHIVPLSDGGDNSLHNLTTLCHICHRSQEGAGHKQIVYFKRSKRR
ncbi:MAG: HNH endonuclease [Candidatus Zixiibacteriota bacterium]